MTTKEQQRYLLNESCDSQDTEVFVGHPMSYMAVWDEIGSEWVEMYPTELSPG